jgi:hypothetical protein
LQVNKFKGKELKMIFWNNIKEKIQSSTRTAMNFVTGGYLDKKKSEDITRWAEDQKAEIEERFEVVKKETKTALENLGRKKIEILHSVVPEFLELLEFIGGNIKQRERMLSSDVASINKMSHQIVVLKNISTEVNQMISGAAGGALGGAALAAGTYGLAGIIGTASTGTAIGSLSGVAATNATLAWLGGGSLSAGGLGMAGGAAVLGGVAALPALVTVMYLGQNKGKQKLNAARNFRDRVDAHEEKIKTEIAQLEKIQEGAKLMLDTISDMSVVLRIQIKKMRNAIKTCTLQSFRLQEILEIPLLLGDGFINKKFLEYLPTEQKYAMATNISDEGLVNNEPQDDIKTGALT